MYEQPPPRRDKKLIRLKSSHNPTGELNKTVNWLIAEEALFHKLVFKSQKMDETYLAAFLSCWLCIFVRPTKQGDVIHLGVS